VGNGPRGVTRAEREAARLLEKIRQAGVPVPEGAYFQQTYASGSQRVEGGAVWVLYEPENHRLIACSIWPRRYLVSRSISAWRDHLGEWHIDPVF
jgi:hypothetical protein